MSARWEDERATAVLDDAGRLFLWVLVVFIAATSLLLAGGLM
jgi:hypothetical protein